MRKASPFTFYFLFYAALAAWAPFLVLYYQSIGLTGAQIGLLTGIAPLITLVGGPFWTSLADTTRRHKLIMSVAIAAAVLGGIMLPFIRSLAPLAVLVVLFAFFTAPVISLADSATMAMLGSKKSLYGRIRLGGTFGWGIAAPLIGLLIERNSLSMAFWSYAALMFMALLVTQTYVFPQGVHGGSLVGGLRFFLKRRSWILFLALAFVFGLGVTTVNNYLFAYMKEQNASETVMGFALTISTISELPVLFFANRLLKRFGSRRLLRVAMAVTGARLLVYAALTSPDAILVSQLMNGLTFPLFWVAGVAFADEESPGGLKATGQGLFGSVMFGFGAATGGLLGGALLDLAGTRGMYLIVGIMMLVSLGLILLADLLLPGRDSAPAPVTVETDRLD